MDAKTLLWSLYNTKTERQIDGLTFLQITGFVEAIAGEQHEDWSAWHEGLKTWKPISEFAEFQQMQTPKSGQSPPKPPSPKGVSKQNTETPLFDFDDEATRAQISLDKGNYSDRRSNRRFLQAYPVQVLLQGATHLNQTVDVSLGGMNLATTLPDALPSSFMAKLTHASGATLTLQCIRIPDINEVCGFAPKRVRFNLDVNVEPVLRTWLFNAQNE